MRSRRTPLVPERHQSLNRPGCETSARLSGCASYSRGFSLIELIVVIIILAIVAAVVVPNVVRSADMQVTSAARMLATDLQYAQDYAITTQTPVTVTFNVSGDSYTLSNTSGTLNHPITKTAYRVDFSSQSGFEQVELVSADFDGAGTVVFDEIGAPDNAGSVVIQAGDYSYRVSIAAATGKVSVAR